MNIFSFSKNYSFAEIRSQVAKYLERWAGYETPRFTHPVPGGGGGTGLTKNLPDLKDHLREKFLCNPSSGLDSYREQTNT